MRIQRLLTPLAAITAAGASAAVSSQLLVLLLGASLPLPVPPGMSDELAGTGAHSNESGRHVALPLVRDPGGAFSPDDAMGVTHPAPSTRPRTVSRPRPRVVADVATDVAVRAARVRDSQALATAWVTRNAGLFGRSDADLRREGPVERTFLGSVVSFRQYLGGVPVIGGQVKVVIGSTGEVLYANGETSRASAEALAADRIGADAARRTAVETVVGYGVLAADVTAQKPSAWIYDPALAGETGNDATVTTVWMVDVWTPAGSGGSHRILVDGSTGSVHHLATDVPAELAFVLEGGAASLQPGASYEPVAAAALHLRDGVDGSSAGIGAARTDDLLGRSAAVLTEGTSYPELAAVLRDVCDLAGLTSAECATVTTASAVLDTASAAPGAPSDSAPVTVDRVEDTVLLVGWEASAWSGLDDITGWIITARPLGEDSPEEMRIQVPVGTDTAEVGGLPAGRSYEISVEALSTSGEPRSAWSITA